MGTDDQVHSNAIIYNKIEEKDSLVKSFYIAGKGKRINLTFISTNFDLNFEFSAPEVVNVITLKSLLNNHFLLVRHAESQVPTSELDLRLSINGRQIGPDEEPETLRNLGVKPGDRVRLLIERHEPGHVQMTLVQ